MGSDEWGGLGGGVGTDGGEGVVLLGHCCPWVWDHSQPCALAVHWGLPCPWAQVGDLFLGIVRSGH